MSERVRRWVGAAGSLRLTAALLVLAMVLVFAGTIAQVRIGVWQAQEDYFRSFWVLWQPDGLPFGIPVLPGGALLGAFLLLNLLASFATTARRGRTRWGLTLVHLGLIVILLGELFAALLGRESQMVLNEGEERNYSEDARAVELAVTDTSPPRFDRVTTVPAALLEPGARIRHPSLPFELRVARYYRNSEARAHGSSGVDLVELPAGTRGDTRDLPSAEVEVVGTNGSLGRWWLSVLFVEGPTLTFEGREYRIALRPRRHYKPFAIQLLDFEHERHPGTDIPKAFSSRVRLIDHVRGEDREVRIRMNHPLRHGGFTFYQHSFANDDTTSILQVVRNPSWLLPYIASTLVGVGLAWQFAARLAAFLAARRAVQGRGCGARRRCAARAWLGAAAAVALAFGLVAGLAARRPPARGVDLSSFARRPVLDAGRVKPLDSVARNALLMLRGRESLAIDGTRTPAIAWLAELLLDPDAADARPVFRIDHPDLKTAIGLGADPGKYFAFSALAGGMEEITRQARLADAIAKGGRSEFHRAALRLHERVALYLGLRSSVAPPEDGALAARVARLRPALEAGTKALIDRDAGRPFDRADLDRLGAAVGDLRAWTETARLRLLPPPAHAHAHAAEGAPWITVPEGLVAAVLTRTIDPGIDTLTRLETAWRMRDPAAFRAASGVGAPGAESGARLRLEEWYNRAAPFRAGMILYVCAFVLACVSWLGPSALLGRLGSGALLGAFALHTAGLAVRMLIEGRPPVTNLYSSAVFIAWGATALALVIEASAHGGIGTAVGGLAGFLGLLVARGLAIEGDTIEVMRAVLDSNFWLAAHVVVIALGYSATFLAGLLGAVCLLAGRTNTPRPDDARSADPARMVYGAVCFALLFSFVGTVLGGIWADQSWGRFWGWDPKENGALLVVLWNALTLHALRAGLIHRAGLMAMAVCGNIVTAWSWFGTNMLGVGLHSYGFMDSAFLWLALFCLFHLAIAGRALVPRRRAAGAR